MKMKRTLKAALSFALCLSMLCYIGIFYTGAEGTHGFYMNCSADVTNRRSCGFMIDFYSDSEDALCTYWSNANWNMDTRQTMKQLGYRNMTGGGAYAGLQIRGSKNDHVGIMSMWLWSYTYKGVDKKLYAESMMSRTSRYDNEGSGTSCIQPYNWKNSQWYRELLFCWDDAETGHTLIGTWYYDYEADVWTLFTYYDTGLVGSFINTGCDQFLENYVDTYNDRYRSFRYRNVYFQSYDTKEWVSQPNVYLYSDANVKAVGECKLGQSEDGTYVWASVDGSSSIDTDQKLELRAKLVQDDTPTVGTPKIGTFDATKLTNIHWKMDSHSTPQLSYEVTVKNRKGEVVASEYATRPHIVKQEFDKVKLTDYEVTLTITDVFGQQTTEVYQTPGYNRPYNPAEELPYSPAGLVAAALCE